MKELIKIIQEKGSNRQLVDARELYEFLGVAARFNDWMANHIRDVEFIEGEDFNSFTKNLVKPTGGRPSKEYHITMDMAKEISMLTKNKKGKEARRYFIEMEKIAVMKLSNIPQTYSQALRLAADQQERIEEQQKQIEADKDKVDFFMAVTDSKYAIEMSKVSKVLDIKGYGRNN